MRLGPRVAETMQASFKEAVLTTPVCGGSTCHIGTLTREERTVDGMLFLNQVADPTLWNDGELERMLAEWNDLAPDGVESDPQYLPRLPPRPAGVDAPAGVRRAHLRADDARQRPRMKAALPSTTPFQPTGDRSGRLVHGVHTGRCIATRATRIELVDAGGGLSRVVITTLGRT
jgi:hypothetical protein